MIQSFQCPICSTLNALGEPECSECGQAFVYNCPVCGTPLNNRYPTCPNCHTIFNWGTSARTAVASVNQVVPRTTFEQQAVPNTSPQRKAGAGAASYTARPAFWITLIVICAVLIALLLIADRIINK